MVQAGSDPVRRLGTVLLSLALLLCGAASASAQDQSRVVSEYRQDFPDISVAQAEANLAAQRKGAGIVNQLKTELGPDYAGVWFDNDSGEFVVPALSGAVRGSVHVQLARAGLEGDYRTVPATHSWADLEAAHDRLDEELLPLIEKGLVRTSLDPRTNAVVVNLAKGASEAQRSEVQGLTSSEDVRTDLRERRAKHLDVELRGCSFPVCDKPLRGGVGIHPYAKEGIYDPSACSAAFKAIGNVYGNRFMLTAGHCARSASEWASDHTGGGEEPQRKIGPVEAYSFPGGDWAKIKANGSYWDTSPWPSAVVYWGGAIQWPIYSEAYTYLGQYVCHSGAASGSSCGPAKEIDTTGETSEGNVYHVAIFGRVCSAKGDSGGAAFAGNTALGIYHGDTGAATEGGGCPGKTYVDGAYVEIPAAADALGVTVGTRIGGAPGAATNSASNVQPYQATLNGQIYPNSVETFYRFEWGKTCYCQHSSEGSAGHGASWVSKSHTATGLDPARKYKFRVRARSAAGTSYGSEATFTTPPAPPKATTESQSNVRVEEEDGKATLNGKVNPGGADTDYRFEWNTVASGNFEKKAPVPDGDAGDGITYKSVPTGIEGLKGSTQYQFRLHAENSEGTATGSVKKFTTPDWRPGISGVEHSEPYTHLGTGRVDVDFDLDPNGFATTYHVEWGDQEEYEEGEYNNSTPEVELEYTGTEPQPVEVTIEGLLGLTKYHYRVVAENAEGTRTVEDEGQVFTTPDWRPEILDQDVRHGITAHKAKLEATIDTNGFTTTYHFEYVEEAEFQESEWENAASTKSGGTAWGNSEEVERVLRELEPETVYRFRVVATNENGTVDGGEGDMFRTLPEPSLKLEIGGEGSGNGQLDEPQGVAVDAGGSLYVSDTGNDRVQKFDSAGGYLGQFGEEGSEEGQFEAPRDIAIDSEGNIYVVDAGNDRVQKFDSEGEFIGAFGESGSGDGEFEFPYGITTDAAGNVYVTDVSLHRVQKFNSEGEYLIQFGEEGSGNGEFDTPYDVAIGPLGLVYVTDMANHRVQIFSGTGEYLIQFGEEGSGEGQFSYPAGIAADSQNNLYVVDWGNERIQVFDDELESTELGPLSFPFLWGAIATGPPGVLWATTSGAHVEKWSQPQSNGPIMEVEGEPPRPFTISGGSVEMQMGGEYIACSGETTGSGAVYNSETTGGVYRSQVSEMTLAFHGCFGGGFSFTSPGESEGTIVTSELEATLVYLDSERTEVGLLLRSPGEEPFAEFTGYFGLVTYVVGGEGALAALTDPLLNEPAGSFEFETDWSEGPVEVEEIGPDYSLEVSINGESPEEFRFAGDFEADLDGEYQFRLVDE